MSSTFEKINNKKGKKKERKENDDGSRRKPQPKAKAGAKKTECV